MLKIYENVLNNESDLDIFQMSREKGFEWSDMYVYSEKEAKEYIEKCKFTDVVVAIVCDEEENTQRIYLNVSDDSFEYPEDIVSDIEYHMEQQGFIAC